MATKRGDGGEGAAARKRRPKGANGLGGASLRADGLWQWRVTLADGRRVSATAKTQEEARRKCLDKAGLAEQGVDLKATRQTLGAFLERWLEDVVRPNAAPKTYASYRDTCRRHIVPVLGHVEIGRLKPADVQRLIRLKQGEPSRLGTPLSARSVAYVRTVLVVALNHAVRFDVVPRNVAAVTVPPRQARAERVPLTPEQVRVFLRAVEGDRLEALYRVTAAYGLRLGEGLGLRWADLDLDAGTLRVRQAVQRVDGRLILKEPKTEKSKRTLALAPALVASLRSHRRRQAEERLAARRWDDRGLVFTNGAGGPLEPANVLRAFKAHLSAAGLPAQRFHDLRHYAATFLLAEGVPARVVMDILGHSQISTTMDIYGHVLPAAHRDVAERVERFLAEPG